LGISHLCPSDYYGKGDSQCFSCPQNSTSEEGSETIFGCKCDSPNHYPNSKASTCTPCPSGFLLDNNSNTCQILARPYQQIHHQHLPRMQIIKETNKLEFD